MNYIIFDLEWNQSTSDNDLITDPMCLPGEIIEIGAVKLDDHFEKIDELKLYIKPQYYSKLHRRIVSLTGIRDQDLIDKGLPFPDAFQQFIEWCGEEYSFMTWSTSDLPILVDNMYLHGIDSFDLPDTYDVQRIFCNEIMRMDRRLSLDDALKMLNEHGDPAHDALHDARNTAIICNHMDMEACIEEYVSRAFSEPPRHDCYASFREALADPMLRECSCPWCGDKLTLEPWLPADHEEFISMAQCTEGDEILVSMELIQANPSKVYARRLIYELSDDLWDVYSQKKEKYTSR